jgi:hypothetical protein
MGTSKHPQSDIRTMADYLLGLDKTEQIYEEFHIPQRYRDHARSSLANNLFQCSGHVDRDLDIYKRLPEDQRKELWERICQANRVIAEQLCKAVRPVDLMLVN